MQWKDGRVALSFRSGSLCASTQRVLEAWSAGESLVSLDGEGFAPLPHSWLDEHGHLLEILLSAEQQQG